uniref:Vomeronasal type-1 receptor n=1 Tax=Cacopsylla melanoneura TaxID=428564 RepID=A0A8D8ZDP0_9HEMI
MFTLFQCTAFKLLLILLMSLSVLMDHAIPSEFHLSNLQHRLRLTLYKAMAIYFHLLIGLISATFFYVGRYLIIWNDSNTHCHGEKTSISFAQIFTITIALNFTIPHGLKCHSVRSSYQPLIFCCRMLTVMKTCNC